MEYFNFFTKVTLPAQASTSPIGEQGATGVEFSVLNERVLLALVILKIMFDNEIQRCF